MSVPRLDIDPESRRVLEFDAVLDRVAAHAATSLGAAHVRALEPIADAATIEAEHATVEEAARHLSEAGRIVERGLPDPSAALEVLAVAGVRISPPAVRDLAMVILAASDLRERLLALEDAAYPFLRALGGRIPDLRAEARPVARGVMPDGRIADEASAELGRIRTAIARVGEKLRRMLEAVLRDPSAGAVIRDDFITQRNGRFVIPVRSDSPRAVAGIVHAASSSGATLFVEPLESVEWNNELVRLAEAESEEQDRIVSMWVDRFRERLPEVRRAVAGLGNADGLQARALFAQASGTSRPAVREGGALRLLQVRHPLLDWRLRERGERAVAASIELAASDRVLVLSGPNAGGKTVALKTLGLAVLMAQSGIPVCAGTAEIPLFVQLRADIGDHQSIDADLSTFSAHVIAVTRFLREARPPVLLLFDEIGTGTDPAEGVALARALLERVACPGFTTVATTHQGTLKTWAFSTTGAVSAALEFDTERLCPTYRILMGAAGVSAGIEVAERLGMDPEIIARARAHLGGGAAEAEASMQRLRELTSDLERRIAELKDRETALEAERERLDRRAESDAQKRSREVASALEAALKQIREEGRREIAGVRDSRERSRLEREQARAARRLEAEASRLGSEITAVASGSAGPESPSLERVAPGMRVLVYSLGKEGEVVSIRGDRVEVRLGVTVFSVARSDLRAVWRLPAGGPVTAPRAPDRSPSRVQAADDLRSEGREIVLIGKTVDEALAELDRYLDQSALADRTEVRIVHGHGTGRLRTAVRRFLAGHAHVASHRPGNDHEGGDGATVARLR